MASHLNKVAIVTGSSSGIGEAIAIMFASRGAKVTLCGRDQDRLKSVFDKLVEVSGGHQDRFIIVQGDIKVQSVRKDIVAKTVEKFGRLDILVANAGVSSDKLSLSLATEESYDTVMDTNLKSVFFLIQQAVPHLEKSKGNIINISSPASTLFLPQTLIYSASKAGLDHMTRCLAVDLGSMGIRVNGIKPGYIPTRIMNVLGDNTAIINKLYGEHSIKLTPLKGKFLTSKDVPAAVAFLTSDAAEFITGEIISIAGGIDLPAPGLQISRM